MKVVYNNKEIINSTNDYNGLLNRPMINSVTLEGVKTISDINAYTKEQIDELIGNSRSIEIVTALPTNLIENTLYYVGPDANDFYDVYLVDEVRNVFNIGTSQFGEYFAGKGIDIDDDNYITTKIDNKTITVDSENNLHAVLDINTVPIMVGATSSAMGEKGLVPAPAIGDNTKQLKGSATWERFIDFIYPVGSVYLGFSSSQNPNTLFPGTTWTQLSSGKALWTSQSNTTTLSAGLPNILGRFRCYPAQSVDGYYSGAFYEYSKSGGFTGFVVGPAFGDTGYHVFSFKASKGTYKTDGTTKMTDAETPYGKSTTVQPKAIKICAWQRTK